MFLNKLFKLISKKNILFTVVLPAANIKYENTIKHFQLTNAEFLVLVRGRPGHHFFKNSSFSQEQKIWKKSNLERGKRWIVVVFCHLPFILPIKLGHNSLSSQRCI